VGRGMLQGLLWPGACFQAVGVLCCGLCCSTLHTHELGRVSVACSRPVCWVVAC
jgi:hypothetical protein